VTAMAQAAQQRLDERRIPEQAGPFGVVQIECRVDCYAELTTSARESLDSCLKIRRCCRRSYSA
jgi:hypothetical protein